MPLYEYQCARCGSIFEIFHGIDETYEGKCPECQGEAKRILSPSNFILKGSGFYVNDYPSDSRKKAKSTEKRPESPEKKSKEPPSAGEKTAEQSA